jgi:hypothetical protein
LSSATAVCAASASSTRSSSRQRAQRGIDGSAGGQVIEQRPGGRQRRPAILEALAV